MNTLVSLVGKKDLKSPPVCFLKVTRHESEGVEKLIKTLSETARELQQHKPTLVCEFSFLSKMNYKYFKRFGLFKFYQHSSKVMYCFRRYRENELDLQALLKYFDGFFEEKTEIYLPSRQTLQCVVVRLMGITGLLIQTSNFCAKAFVETKKHLSTMNFLHQSLMYLSLFSRLWVLSRSLVECLRNCYEGLIRNVSVLPPTQVVWLSDIDPFPENLLEWLETNLGVVYQAFERFPDVEDDKQLCGEDEEDIGEKMYSFSDTSGNRLEKVCKRKNLKNETNEIFFDSDAGQENEDNCALVKQEVAKGERRKKGKKMSKTELAQGCPSDNEGNSCMESLDRKKRRKIKAEREEGKWAATGHLEQTDENHQTEESHLDLLSEKFSIKASSQKKRAKAKKVKKNNDSVNLVNQMMSCKSFEQLLYLIDATLSADGVLGKDCLQSLTRLKKKAEKAGHKGVNLKSFLMKDRIKNIILHIS